VDNTGKQSIDEKLQHAEKLLGIDQYKLTEDETRQLKEQIYKTLDDTNDESQPNRQLPPFAQFVAGGKQIRFRGDAIDDPKLRECYFAFSKGLSIQVPAVRVFIEEGNTLSGHEKEEGNTSLLALLGPDAAERVSNTYQAAVSATYPPTADPPVPSPITSPDGPPGRRGQALGSGAIVESNGSITTTNHVVE